MRLISTCWRVLRCWSRNTMTLCSVNAASSASRGRLVEPLFESEAVNLGSEIAAYPFGFEWDCLVKNRRCSGSDVHCNFLSFRQSRSNHTRAVKEI